MRCPFCAKKWSSNILVGNGRQFQAGHFLKHTHYLAAVSELIIVPDIENAAVSLYDGRQGINDTGVA
jgi:hypothetical protein